VGRVRCWIGASAHVLPTVGAPAADFRCDFRVFRIRPVRLQIRRSQVRPLSPLPQGPLVTSSPGGFSFGGVSRVAGKVLDSCGFRAVVDSRGSGRTRSVTRQEDPGRRQGLSENVHSGADLKGNWSTGGRRFGPRSVVSFGHLRASRPRAGLSQGGDHRSRPASSSRQLAGVEDVGPHVPGESALDPCPGNQALIRFHEIPGVSF